jgi:hypothetical protein
LDYSRGGQLAYYDATTNDIYLGGNRLATSPASEFGGMDPRLRLTEMKWSPTSRYVAFVLDSAENYEQFGVWVVDLGTGESWQVMRNDPSQGRRATDVTWSENGTVLLIEIAYPGGTYQTFLPIPGDSEARRNQANLGFRIHPYQDASWSLDQGYHSVIVSGMAWPSDEHQHGQGPQLGRINLFYEPGTNPFTSYNSYLPAAGIGYTRAATEIPDPLAGGTWVVAFLGAPAEGGPYRLYVMPRNGGTPVVRSNRDIPGQIVSWEWNEARTALLAVVQTAQGRRLWIVNTSGASYDAGPAPLEATWR